MGRDKYPKMLTSAFDHGVGLITELEEADIYATDRI